MNKEEKINNQLKEIPNIDIERKEKFYEWIKNIVSISVVFLGIIISLKSDNCISDLKRIFFILSLFSITIGIILGIIILYSEIHSLNLLRKNILEHTQELINGKETSVSPKPVILNIYNYIIFICFSFYIISLISIVIYSCIKF
ncbi:MAG: hypothetical protein WCJ62_01650 [Flavobacterium sp.]